jgi:hypothetical protein
MSLLKNIDIWKGDRPRVCNFDLEDYCVSGYVGNNTTGLNGITTTGQWYLDPEGLLLTAAATGDAYMKSIDEIVLATMAHYVDNESTDGNPFPGCITEAEWNGIWDFLNGPAGPYLKHRDYVIQRNLFFNSLMPTRLKRTDIATYDYKINIRPYQGPNSTETIYFTVDYSTSLYPTLETYKNYTKSVRDLTQSVKRFLQALDKDTFPIYQP